MKQSPVSKYFAQSNWSVWETLLVLCMVVLGFVACFVTNGGPTGGPALVGVVIAFAFLRSSKVKDQVIDQHIQTLLKENGLDESTAAVAFDFRHPATRKGKNHQLRSPLLWAVEKKESLLTVTALLLTESRVTTQTYPLDHSLKLEENWIATPAGDKKCWFLTGDCLAELTIPVNMNDAHIVRVIEQILNDKV